MSENTVPIFAYFGHHKCASEWVKRIVIDLCSLLGLTTFTTHLAPRLPLGFESSPRFQQQIRGARARCTSGNFDFLMATNADSSLLLDLKARTFRAFHVIRDPRDIIVSGYFSHLSSHPVHPYLNPWLIEHRSQLAALDREAGLLLELGYASTYLERLSKWDYHNPSTYETRFEILTADPRCEMRRILEFCGIVIGSSRGPEGVSRIIHCPEEVYDSVMCANVFENRSGGRSRGEQDLHNHFRLGVPGDFKNHFTQAIHARFNELYPGLVRKLGYEEFEG
jgi:Sulfotransferase domain